MKLALIIPTLNNETALFSCLKSLERQTWKKYDVWVVDSGSEDGTVNVANEFGVNVLHQPPLGDANACNFGAEESEGDVLVFTHPESVFPEKWLERIARHFFFDDKTVAVGGPVRPLHGNVLDGLIFRGCTEWIPALTAKAGVYIFQGANHAYKREGFELVGGFDEKINTLIETRLANRMRGVGRVKFDRSMVVWSGVRKYKKKGYVNAVKEHIGEYIEMLGGDKRN